MAAPPPNWQANFQQGLRDVSQRFQTGALQFGQMMQETFNGAQSGFQSAANRASVAANRASVAFRGYSEKFNPYGATIGVNRNSAIGGFPQLSSANPQFGAPQTMNNFGPRNNFDFNQKSTPSMNPSRVDDPAGCSARTIIGLILIFIILAAGGGGVGILISLNNAKDNQAADFGAADSNFTGNATLEDANSKFKIDLVFQTSASTAQKNAFFAARARWESVMTAALGSQALLPKGSTFCGTTITQDMIVDDLLIFVNLSPIDGKGKILGSAGPCGFDEDNIPRLGSMQFDTADVEELLEENQFKDVVLHEMGHVLGLGSLWETSSFLNPPSSGNPDDDPKETILYTGSQGNIGNHEIGGSGPAIVENIGGQGTARGHWKDSVYQNELMTGFLSPNVNPMSRLTIRALSDLGYQTDPTKADKFKFPSGRRLRESEGNRRAYGNDIHNHPLIQMHTRKKGSSEGFKIHPLKPRKKHTT